LKRVSVIIPVYNCERYIASAIRSVLEQTYTNWELIIVNDGSTDGTLEICQSFLEKDIKIINQINQGISAARNAGIRNSQGEYIALLDADDIWFPNKLEKQVSFLDSHPLIGLVTCGSWLIDEEGSQFGMKQILKAGHITAADIFLLNPIKNGSAPLLRRQTLEDIRFEAQMTNDGTGSFDYFDPLLGAAEDLDCWLRIALRTTWEIWGIPDYAVYYRITQTGVSSSVDRYHAQWLKVQEKIRSFHPRFYREHAKYVEAFEYRYLTQRGILAGVGKNKVLQLSFQFIRAAPRIILKDSFVNFVTLIAAWSYFLLPRSFFQKILFPLQRMLSREPGNNESSN